MPSDQFGKPPGQPGSRAERPGVGGIHDATDITPPSPQPNRPGRSIEEVEERARERRDYEDTVGQPRNDQISGTTPNTDPEKPIHGADPEDPDTLPDDNPEPIEPGHTRPGQAPAYPRGTPGQPMDPETGEPPLEPGMHPGNEDEPGNVNQPPIPEPQEPPYHPVPESQGR